MTLDQPRHRPECVSPGRMMMVSAGDNFVRTQLKFLAATPHSHPTRQGVDQGLDRTPPTANRVAFDHLGEEHEKRDDERGEKLPRCTARQRAQWSWRAPLSCDACAGFPKLPRRWGSRQSAWPRTPASPRDIQCRHQPVRLATMTSAIRARRKYSA